MLQALKMSPVQLEESEQSELNLSDIGGQEKKSVLLSMLFKLVQAKGKQKIVREKIVTLFRQRFLLRNIALVIARKNVQKV